jgi:SAM-dependent methyltransferase
LSGSFDCIIFTQVLQYVADPAAVIRSLSRLLKRGGVILATTAGISQISRWDDERWGDYWRFTTLSAKDLFGAMFPLDHVDVQAHGNVLAAVAFLHGLAAQEFRTSELDHRDDEYQLLITVRAVRPLIE